MIECISWLIKVTGETLVRVTKYGMKGESEVPGGGA